MKPYPLPASLPLLSTLAENCLWLKCVEGCTWEEEQGIMITAAIY
jgi:hypothetical protein